MEYMFMPLKRYAEFSGRSRRMEYWMWFVFLVLLYIAFWVVMAIVGAGGIMTGNPRAALAAGGVIFIVAALFLLIELALIIPGIAVAVRRLHDTNRSGWWVLSPFIGYALVWIGLAMAASGSSAGGILSAVGMLVAAGFSIALLVFMFLDGTKGPNRFGPDPKGRVNAEVFA